MLRRILAALAALLVISACNPREAGGESALSVSVPAQPPVSGVEPSRQPDPGAQAPVSTINAESAQDLGQSEKPEPQSEEEPAEIEPSFAVEAIPLEVAEAITDSSWTADCPVALDQLRLVLVTYIDFEGEAKQGRLIAHQQTAGDLAEIFEELFLAGFPLAGVALIDEYGADDNASMAANNSYCFCSRMIAGTTRYSNHSYGIAVDINPVQNPYVLAGVPQPAAAAAYMDRGQVRPGMIVEGDLCYNAFVSRGWSWGGHWASPDYQHFEKPLEAE